MRWWWVVALAGVGCGRLAFDPIGVVDDAEPDGSGSASVNIAFVTSTNVQPSTLGGQIGADAFCAQRAAAAGLPTNTYVAWLSTSTSDAKTRVGDARGWVRTDGLPFADTLDALLMGRVLYPLRIDENKLDRPNAATLTGTSRDGVFHTSASQCADFMGLGTATFGWSDGGTDIWTEQPGFDCGEPAPLYCFGIDHQTEVTVAPVTGRRAFVTKTGFGATSGLAGADAICEFEAQDAGLPGTFRALLADNGATAASRFNLAGGPWYRVDGVALTSDLVTLRAPINLHADGVTELGLAWTGAASPITPGDLGSTCNGWTSAAASGVTGTIGRSGPSFFGGGPLSCSLGPGVYCFEL
jgi:hypothetical protein